MPMVMSSLSPYSIAILDWVSVFDPALPVILTSRDLSGSIKLDLVSILVACSSVSGFFLSPFNFIIAERFRVLF